MPVASRLRLQCVLLLHFDLHVGHVILSRFPEAAAQQDAVESAFDRLAAMFMAEGGQLAGTTNYFFEQHSDVHFLFHPVDLAGERYHRYHFLVTPAFAFSRTCAMSIDETEAELLAWRQPLETLVDELLAEEARSGMLLHAVASSSSDKTKSEAQQALVMSPRPVLAAGVEPVPPLEVTPLASPDKTSRKETPPPSLENSEAIGSTPLSTAPPRSLASPEVNSLGQAQQPSKIADFANAFDAPDGFTARLMHSEIQQDWVEGAVDKSLSNIIKGMFSCLVTGTNSLVFTNGDSMCLSRGGSQQPRTRAHRASVPVVVQELPDVLSVSVDIVLLDVLRAVNGIRTVGEIQQHLSVTDEQIRDTLAQLVASSVVVLVPGDVSRAAMRLTDSYYTAASDVTSSTLVAALSRFLFVRTVRSGAQSANPSFANNSHLTATSRASFTRTASRSGADHVLPSKFHDAAAAFFVQQVLLQYDVVPCGTTRAVRVCAFDPQMQVRVPSDVMQLVEAHFVPMVSFAIAVGWLAEDVDASCAAFGADAVAAKVAAAAVAAT